MVILCEKLFCARLLEIIPLFHSTNGKNQKDKKSLTPLPSIMEKVIC